MCKKRILSFLLVLALLAGLISGCAGRPSDAPQAETDPGAVGSAETPGEAPVPPAPSTPSEPDPDLPSIPWSTAFHDSSVPDGSLPAGSIAFLNRDGDGAMHIVNVPREEVYANRPERVPRTHFFEQFMPQEMIDELLPVLDYAVVNGCSRVCFPASSVTYMMIRQASRYLSYTYDINDKGRIDPLPIQRISLEDGELNYLMVTLRGMEKGGSARLYSEGLAAAQAIVDAMPEDLDEPGKMLYLYRYVCENVWYDDDMYYESNDWCFLYDGLVLHKTLCAGYAETLFVLCSLAGLDGFIITGEIGGLGSWDDLHAWNLVRVDGKYYEFDATWDQGRVPEYYLWYGMSEDYTQKYHTRLIRDFEQEIMPPHPDSLRPVPSSDQEGSGEGG